MLYHKTVLFCFVRKMYLKLAGCLCKIYITSRTFGSQVDIFFTSLPQLPEFICTEVCALCKGLCYMLGDQNYLHYKKMGENG